jgi:hypothetical protein
MRSFLQGQKLVSLRCLVALVAVVAAMAVAVPASAYTIYLKDGSRLIAKDKYVIRDGKALIVLQSGATVSYDASEIDVPRTDAENTSDYGSAVILDQGKAAPRKQPVEQKTTLTDLINKRRTGLRSIPESRRPVEIPDQSDAERTPGGYLDLKTFPRAAYADVDLAGELQQQFRSKQIETVNVYAGPAEKTPLVEVETNTEASVFRAVAVACNALVEIRKSRPDALQEINLLLVNSRNENAGQFQISPAMAEALLTRKIDISGFFVAYVQF